MILSSVITLTLCLSAPVLGYYPVVGPSGGVQPRLEVRTLAQNADQWNMFLLGMRKFQQQPETAVDSFYAIAAIHGTPQAYDDSPRSQPRANTRAGYCFHNTEQFFLWHRPYMSVFEQSLVKHAVDVANTYKDANLKARYLKAAQALRMPYWDWASDSTVPNTVSAQNANIIDPATGRQTSIPNPLYQYTFQNPRSSPIGSATTIRGNGYQNAMANALGDLQGWTATMYNTPNVCWNVFASNSGDESSVCPAGSIPQFIVSLESIHNDIHTTVCGSMCSFGSAAYDPIFWLHHANVDRLGALWQAINYNAFVISTTTTTSTYAQAAGRIDGNTPLMPFHNANSGNAWWTSTGVRDTKSLGYTYPELQQGEVSAQDLSSSVQAQVNQLYGGGRALQNLAQDNSPARAFAASFRVAPEQDEKASAAKAAAGKARDLTTPPTTEELQAFKDMLIANNGSFPDYLARVNIIRGEGIPIGFKFNLYFGSDAAENRVGSMSILSGADMPERKFKADIAFTNALLNKLVSGDIKSLDSDAVKTYSKKNLQWKAIGGDGTDYSAQVKVKIAVVKNIVQPAATPELPPAVAPGAPVANVSDTIKA